MENKARVITEHRGSYKVVNENGEFLAKITGKRIFDALSREDFPAVGDWVIIDELPEKQAVIKEILPRKSIIKRKSIGKSEVQVIATNIDVAFVVESLNKDFNLNRLERYSAIASDSGIKPTIILNKVDLISEEELKGILQQIKDRFLDIDVITTSALTNKGLSELKEYIKENKTYCFLGSSGVGKSSLINNLLGKELIKTGDISFYTERGKHITTNRQMYFLDNGGIVIDNPGMREVGMTDTEKGIENFFEEIVSLNGKCKYNDCSHIHEKDCAVIDAVKSGKIDEEQYNNYVNLKKESEHYEMSATEKKRKERNFGKFIKNTKKVLKEHNHKDY